MLFLGLGKWSYRTIFFFFLPGDLPAIFAGRNGIINDKYCTNIAKTYLKIDFLLFLQNQ